MQLMSSNQEEEEGRELRAVWPGSGASVIKEKRRQIWSHCPLARIFLSQNTDGEEGRNACHLAPSSPLLHIELIYNPQDLVARRAHTPCTEGEEGPRLTTVSIYICRRGGREDFRGYWARQAGKGGEWFAGYFFMKKER